MQYKVLKECVIESIFYQKGQLYRPSKEMSWWLDRDLADDNIIVQSTNLFDKDGNEIFEGSIVEDRCSGLNWLVFIENGEVFIRHRGAVMHYGYISTGTKKWVETNVKRIGHILSNPELLEKKDV